MANLSNINNKLLVGTNGEVRIGDTATVANVKLRVKQTAQQWTAQFVNTDSSVAYGISIDTSASSYGAAGTLQCYTNSGGGFVVRNDGNVGIGTGSPNAKLTVNKTKSGTGVENYDLIRLGLLGTGAVGDSSTIGWFSTTGTKTAGIEGISGLDNILYGELAFHVRRYTTDSYDRVMTINNRGNVGIATATPQKKLHIEGTGGASEMQILVSSASDTVGHTAGIGLRGEGGEADGDFRIKGGIFFERIAGSFGNGKMILAVNSSVSNTSVTVADHALTIDTNKNVGIGTASPTSKIDVREDANNVYTGYFYNSSTAANAHGINVQTATTNAGAYAFRVNSASNSNALAVMGNARVGIGTASPDYTLHLLKSSGDTEMYINGQNGQSSLRMGLDARNWQIKTAAAPYLWSLNYVGTDFQTPNIITATVGGNVGIGEPSPNYKLNVASATNTDGIYLSGLGTAMSNGEYRQIQFGYSDTDTSYGSTIRFVVPNAATHGGKLEFYTDAGPGSSSGLGALALGMVIDDEQRVGIGTTGPSAKLEIKATGATTGLTFRTTDSSNNETFYINDGGTVGVRYYPFKIGVASGTTNVANSRFQVATTAGDFVILNDGKTGIGATSPTAKLYLNSSISNGSSLWTFAPSGQFAYTGHKNWTSINGTATSNGYYTIGTIEDSRSAMINIKTAAHSNATLLVSRGYGQSNVARFQILSSTKNANGGYANITGVRIAAGGKVDIQLAWSSGPIIEVEITVYGNGFTLPSTLDPSSTSVGGNYPNNVLQTIPLAGTAASAYVSGLFQVGSGIASPATFGTTTGSAANMVVDVNGTFFRSTSSSKYKKDIRDYDKGLNEVMQLKPKYYKGKDDEDVQFAGLIAEDVHDLGLNEFVQYAEDNTPDALAYPNMIALLTKAIQELKAEIDELKK